jgi:hypothetical protein
MSYIQYKRFFYINSKNRLSGTDSNFSFNLEIPQNQDYDKVVVLQASIPKSYFLVESGYNTFQLQEDTSAVTITIPVGSYTRRSFQTTLQQKLRSYSPHGYVYTVSYPNTSQDADTGKFTYSVTGNGLIQPKFIFTTNLNEQLGFDRNSTNSFVANTLDSQNVIKLQAEDTLYLHSDLVANGTDNVLQEIFANSNPSYSSINFLNPCPNEYSKQITNSNGATYNFYLTSEDPTEVIDLNGQNLQIVLMMYKENNIFNTIKDFIKYSVYVNSPPEQVPQQEQIPIQQEPIQQIPLQQLPQDPFQQQLI